MSIPDRLGDFEIVEEIGRGGFGVVYEARQVSLDRSVALKVLYQHRVHTDEEVGRFEREAHAAGRIDHPAVVQVYAWGEQDGNFYLAQKLVGKGKTLADRLEELKGGGEPPKGYFRQVAEALAHVAEGLQSAHEKGVIHRDIKPSNILLDQKGKAFLGDFGLAKIEDGLELSRTGEMAGSPYYMSPEQADSKRGEFDHRSDIYSLGVALYELLTLEPPFTGRSAHEIIRKILTEEPRRPTKVEPRVPRDLETICLKAMEKARPRRYQSAEAFAKDLHAFLDGEPISAVPASTVSRVWRQAKRHTSSVGMAVMGVVLLSVAYYAYGLQGDNKEREHVLDETLQVSAENEARLTVQDALEQDKAALEQDLDERIRQALEENDLEKVRALQDERSILRENYEDAKAFAQEQIAGLTDTENLTSLVAGLSQLLGAGEQPRAAAPPEPADAGEAEGEEGLRLAEDLTSIFSRVRDASGRLDFEAMRRTGSVPERQGDPLAVVLDEDDETADGRAARPIDAGPPPTSADDLGSAARESGGEGSGSLGGASNGSGGATNGSGSGGDGEASGVP